MMFLCCKMRLLLQALLSLILASAIQNKASAAASSSSSFPPCTVASTEVYVDQFYTCGSNFTNTRTKIYYPTGQSGNDKKKRFPVVFFARGSGGYVSGSKYENGYNDWLENIAEQCLIVIAPMTGRAKSNEPESFQNYKCFEDYDLMIAYEWTKHNRAFLESNIFDGTKHAVDIERVGIIGHSGGGHHIPSLQANYHIPNVQGVVFSHGGSDLPLNYWWPADHNVASMFLTASQDTNVVLNADVWKWYQANKERGNSHYHTVFASTSGGHMEPVAKYGKVFDAWTGRFLACHLYTFGTRKEETCSRFYGKSADVCYDQNLEASSSGGASFVKKCDVSGSALVI